MPAILAWFAHIWVMELCFLHGQLLCWCFDVGGSHLDEQECAPSSHTCLNARLISIWLAVGVTPRSEYKERSRGAKLNRRIREKQYMQLLQRRRALSAGACCRELACTPRFEAHKPLKLDVNSPKPAPKVSSRPNPCQQAARHKVADLLAKLSLA